MRRLGFVYVSGRKWISQFRVQFLQNQTFFVPSCRNIQRLW